MEKHDIVAMPCDCGVQKNTAEEYRADKVMFVITTDGMENTIREFDYSKIKTMIGQQKEKYGWEFVSSPK
jgi:hypothetical protein